MSKFSFFSGYLVVLILLIFDVGDLGTPDFDQRGFILNIVLLLSLSLLFFFEKRKAKKEADEE